MKTSVKKWGNSMAVRIPALVAKDLQIRDGAIMEISVDAGKIILKPEKKSAVDLNKLLSKVNSSNIHGETDTGKSVGRESSL